MTESCYCWKRSRKGDGGHIYIDMRAILVDDSLILDILDMRLYPYENSKIIYMHIKQARLMKNSFRMKVTLYLIDFI